MDLPDLFSAHREPLLDESDDSTLYRSASDSQSTSNRDAMTAPSWSTDADSDLSSPPSSAAFSPRTPQSQSPLLRTPSEIIHRVLLKSGADEPHAIASAAKTCKELRDFIYDNPDQALWRDIHLARFDDPRRAGGFNSPRNGLDWRQRVQDREFVARICREWDTDRYDELPMHLDLIVSTLMDMYLDLPASPDPVHSDSCQSSSLASDETRNGLTLATLLRSDVFKHIYLNLSTRETKPLLRPLRAQPGNPNRRSMREAVNPDLMRLHVLLAPEFLSNDEVHRKQRGYLREVVYSASNFSERNDWAPLHADGSVDWTLVDAIGSVMMSNAKDVLTMGEEGWRQSLSAVSYGIEPVRGWGFNDLKRPANLADDDVWDWAGIEGTWCGSYAFLDYTDWIALNEPRLIQLRRSANGLDLSRYHEAIGDLMRLDLVIDRPESSKAGSASRPRENLPEVTTPLLNSNLLPPIKFHGSSVQQSGMITYPSNAAASYVRGVVQLTSDNPPQIRWTLVIRYGGEDRWRLECVQVGGRGSKRGFFGVWTDAMKEEHSPNGPVWYWKP